MTYGQLRFLLARDLPGVDPDKLDLRINARIESICNRTRWKTLETDSDLTTTALYQTGTVNLTQGSPAVTGAGTTFTSAMTGMRFRCLERTENYTFTYTDATDGTLDRPYEGDTTTAAAFILYQNLYPLPADFKEPRDATNERLPSEIRYVDRTMLNVSAPSRPLFGEPLFWSLASPLVDGSGNITYVAELFPIPEWAADYPFRYIAKLPQLGDADTSYQLPEWMSMRGLEYGVKADLVAAGSAEQGALEAVFQYELKQMLRQDAARRGPQALRMHPKFTRHRIERVLTGYRYHPPMP